MSEQVQVVRVAGLSRPFVVITAPPGTVTVDGEATPCAKFARAAAEAIEKSTGACVVLAPDFVKVTVVAPDAQGVPPPPKKPRCELTCEGYRCVLEAKHGGLCLWGNPPPEWPFQ